VSVTGLELPKGSREQLRIRDRLYSYVPASGHLTYTHRGAAQGKRSLVERVLNDILTLQPGGPPGGRILGPADSEAA